MCEYLDISDMLGKTLTKVVIKRPPLFDEDRITFYCDDGTRYVMIHEQQE